MRCAGARERAQAARLLHRRHLLLAGRLALRHVVHLHMVVDSFGTGRLLGYLVPADYQRGSCNGLSAGFMLRARAARDCARRHARVRTGVAGSSLLLILVWIVFT